MEEIEELEFNNVITEPIINIEQPITEEFVEEEFVEQIPEEPIKVYIKVNNNNEVIDINSELFIQDLTNWIEIDSGFGDKYAHAQSQYFPNSLMSEEGKWNYKYIDGKIVEN